MMCGSKNTDISEGHSSCKDCGAEMDIHYSMELTNTPDLLQGKEGGNNENAEEGAVPGEGEEMIPGGEELGGGAPPMGGGASPTGPAGPALPGMPGAAASSKNHRTVLAENMPIAVMLSWDCEPEEFIRTAMVHASEQSSEGPLSAGHVCPECAGKEKILRTANSTGHTKVICASCGHIGNLKLSQAKNKQGEVVIRNEYTYVI